MNINGEPRSRGRVIGEWLLWTTAGLTVLAAHAGAVALMLREPPIELADGAPPAAIMIELAPEPEAVITEETEVSSETVDAEEIKTASNEPLPEPMQEPPVQPLPEPPPPEPVVEEEVVEKIVEPPPVVPEPLPEPIEEIDPIDEMVMAQLDNIEVPIPMVRPPVPEPQVEKKQEAKPKKVVKKQQTPPASQAARQAKADVTQSNRTAARQTNSGSGSNMSPAKWNSRVHAHIVKRSKSLSGKFRIDAIVGLYFTFDPSGNVTSVSVRRSSGNPALDEAAASMVRRASPLPAPPANTPNFLSVSLKIES
jgi:protein TonB